MTSLKTSIKTITYLSDTGCLEIQGASLLWQHIARRSTNFKVFILDTDSARYYPFDGDRICYDGESIPESEIWSEHPDRNKHGVVLVAESVNGKAA